MNDEKTISDFVRLSDELRSWALSKITEGYEDEVIISAFGCVLSHIFEGIRVDDESRGAQSIENFIEMLKGCWEYGRFQDGKSNVLRMPQIRPE